MSICRLAADVLAPRRALWRAPEPIRGLKFLAAEIREAALNGRLLRLSLELCHNRCPLRCIYCYSRAGRPVPGEVSDEIVAALFHDARALGARTAVLTGGGEPLIDASRLLRVVGLAEKAGLWSVIFTNGILLTRSLAAELYDRPVSIITKVNSPPDDPEPTDWLCGRKGTHARMWAATELLLSIGFAAAHPTRLGLETVIVPRNLVHIPELWRFCRERNIFPYFEFVKMQGRAEHHEPDLRVPPAEARDLFEWLRDIDRADYGLDWPMLPPIAAYRCTQIYCGCYVTGRGSMQPCPGIPFGVGRIMLQNGRTNLEDLLRRDPFPALRQIRYKVSGPCQSCQVDPERLCYGCRACAYLGDGVSASDPTCWNVAPAARTGA